MMRTNFYDTCALLELKEKAFSQKFIISNITLQELENIKTSANKDTDVKYNARNILRLLREYPDNYTLILHKLEYEQPISDIGFEISNDTKILSDAIACSEMININFVTEDLSLAAIASSFFDEEHISNASISEDKYLGYKEYTPTDEELASLYELPQENIFKLLTNEYVILRDQENKIIDVRKWSGNEYKRLNTSPIVSKWFGEVKPKDVYQQIALDSFYNNTMTYVGGPAGSGKSYLALGFLLQQLEKGKINQIVIFCNPVVAKNAVKLGFYPGTVIEKLLSTQIGHILASKIGDISEVEKMIENEDIILIPAGDARGYQTKPYSGVYIVEAQNYDVTLLRMILQRIDDTSIVICDGDREEQTDLAVYDGNNNGLQRMSQIFKGKDFYGQAELKRIYRSKIASVAEEMK